ncbi:PH domain-containing protein [Entamoeba marina]
MTFRQFLYHDSYSFEQWGFFILYILGLLYSGYGFFIVIEYYLIPACNGVSQFVTRIIKNAFLANLIMITAASMPEFFIALIGYSMLGEMVFPSSIIFGCTLVNTILLTGLASFISLDNVVVTKTAFVRDATFFIVSVIIVYFFASNYTRDSLDKTPDATMTYLPILLWISLFIYVMYIIALTMMSFFSKKRIYDHHFGFFGNLLNRRPNERSNSPQLDTIEQPIFLRDDTIVQLYSGLLFVKSPYYTNITYSSLQWKQHWCDLFRDELVIHKDVNPASPVLQTIPISSISKVTCDTMDPTFFILSMWNGSYTVKYTFRSSQRSSWVAYFEVLLQENKTLVKGKRPDSFFQMVYRKFSWKPTTSDAQSFLQYPRDVPSRIVFILFLPLLVLLTYTIPDVRVKKCARLGPITIIISLIYCALFAFIGIFCGFRLSKVVTCPSDVLGFTFVALCLSIRHIVSGWVGGRLMCANLAVLHSYSMSLFFTNVAPVTPWMIYYYTKVDKESNSQSSMSSDSFFESSLLSNSQEPHRYTTGALEVVILGMIFVTICHLFSAIGFKNLTISHAFGAFLVICYCLIFIATLLTWISTGV